jgi:hypothetical protein
MFVIEDEAHVELQSGEYPTLEAATNELRRRATIPWDQEPTVAPCNNWRSCGRRYEIIEYDNSETPWKVLSRRSVLDINAEYIRWHK